MRKPLLCHMRTTKTQISLCIRAVWSVPFLFAASIVNSEIAKAPISLACDCSQLFCDSMRELVSKLSWTARKVRNILAGVENWLRTVCENFEHVQNFYATKLRAKQSQSHRMCLEPVANHSQTHRNLVSASHNVRRIFHTNKNKLRTNCDSFASILRENKTERHSRERRETLARMSHDRRASVVNVSQCRRICVAIFSCFRPTWPGNIPYLILFNSQSLTDTLFLFLPCRIFLVSAFAFLTAAEASKHAAALSISAWS